MNIYRTKLISIALFNLKYELEDGDDDTLELLGREGLFYTDKLVEELDELYKEFREATSSEVLFADGCINSHSGHP